MVSLTLLDRIVMKQDSVQTHVKALNDGEVLKYHKSFCFITFYKIQKKRKDLERLLLAAAAADICFFNTARHQRHKFNEFAQEP